jgi:hypothetical protein
VCWLPTDVREWAPSYRPKLCWKVMDKSKIKVVNKSYAGGKKNPKKESCGSCQEGAATWLRAYSISYM